MLGVTSLEANNSIFGTTRENTKVEIPKTTEEEKRRH